MSKRHYFLSSLVKFLARRALTCPACGSAVSHPIARKFLITSLRRCDSCRLLFRSPTTSVEENASFYQQDYEEGFTTEMPSDLVLRQMLETRFASTPKDYTGYVCVLRALGLKAGDRILDFGCSWGYGTWQIREAGFDVVGYEISLPRGSYAKDKLKIPVVDNLDELVGDYDCIFSAHVIEHVPNVLDMIEFARRRLRPGGLFVAFTPNGDQKHRQCDPQGWQRFWGMVHPQLMDSEFLAKNLPDVPLLLGSRPVALDQLAGWQRKGLTLLPLGGDELLVVFQNFSDPRAVSS